MRNLKRTVKFVYWIFVSLIFLLVVKRQYEIERLVVTANKD